jgi:hypothetical protein
MAAHLNPNKAFFYFMELSEKEVENYVFEDLTENDGHGLALKGLELPFMNFGTKVLWRRQLNIEPYGIIDIVGFYRYHGVVYVDLIELKKVNIEPAHFEQVARYKKGIEVYLSNTFKNPHVIVNMIVIGSKYGGHFIQNDFPVTVYSFDYSLDGINFEVYRKNCNWSMPEGKNKSFRNPKRKK